MPERPQAPRFKIRSVAGKTLDLEKLRRQGPVLLDFWATWCKPCIAAIPELQELHEELGPRGLTVIGISTDGPNNFSKVRPFANRLGVKYPIALDEDGGMAEKYQVRAMPTTVLIDTSGAVVMVQQGFRPGEGARMRKAIVALLEPLDADSAATETVPPVMTPYDTAAAPPDTSGNERRRP